MAGQVFGLDFGTTNSLVSFIGGDGHPINLTDATGRPHPSVVWYRGSEVIVGRKARENLDAGAEAITGSFVRSPKRLLESNAPVHVAGRDLDSRDVISEVLKLLRTDAATAHGESYEINRAVLTIPVRLDGAGRRRLREAARKAQISIVQFVHEPLAALYAYLRSQNDYRRRLAELDGCRIIVFDWGGGTLDLTLCQIHRNQIVQIANFGDNEVGGDRFDEVIRNRVREIHSREHGIEDLVGVERDEARISLLNQCELRKIDLSQRETATVFVRNYLKHEGAGRDLSVPISSSDIASWTRELIERGLRAIDALLEHNHLSHQQIALCLPTGGMINMPAIRDGLNERFGGRAPRLPNSDRIISEGAAWIAHDRLRLGLAKPIEILQSDDSYAPIVPLPFPLPPENEIFPAANAIYRCVDPRPGRATFTFARPCGTRARDVRTDRQAYATFDVEVDGEAPPLMERLELKIGIDHDYVARVDLFSSMRKHRVSAEIFDLEFTVSFPGSHENRGEPSQLDEDGESSSSGPGAQASTALGGRVQLRSNVSAVDSWQKVPGDLILQYRPDWFDERAHEYSDWQKEEWTYYKDCPYCHRSRYQYRTEGCDTPQCLWKLVYPVTNTAGVRRQQKEDVDAAEVVDRVPPVLPVPEGEVGQPPFGSTPKLTEAPQSEPNTEEATVGLDGGSVVLDAPPVVSAGSTSSINDGGRQGQQSDESEGQKSGRTPRQYRIPRRVPPSSGPSPEAAPRCEADVGRTNSRALPLDVRLTYEKGGFCRVSLLPRRASDLPSDFELATGNGSYAFVALQDEWYQDVFPENLGNVLREGVEWAADLPDCRPVRWSLRGRPIYVLSHHDELSGFVASQRLTIGEEHVVLCLEDRLNEVKAAIELTASPAAMEMTPASGLPEGWVGLRGIVPRNPVPSSSTGDVLDSLRPLADVEIVFEGGIRVERQTWLHGYPPRIRLRGDTSSISGVLIDGKPAKPRETGCYEANGWDHVGEHSVWCSSMSHSYSIGEAIDAWEPWDAYTCSLGGPSAGGKTTKSSICGALVRPHRANSVASTAAVVPASNTVLLGANPGEIEFCRQRDDLRATISVGFPSFEPVWAAPVDPLRCDKEANRVLLIGKPQRVGSQPSGATRGPQATQAFRNLLTWCSIIRMAGRKGLRTEPSTPDIAAIWRGYKQRAKVLSRRSR